MGYNKQISPRNAGQLVLLALAEAGGFGWSRATIRRVGCSYNAWMHWLNDGIVPPERFRAFMASDDELQIASHWWLQPPDYSDEPGEDLLDDEAFEAPDFTKPDVAAKLVEQQCTRLALDVHKARNRLAPADAGTIVKLEGEYRRACQDLAKLRRELGPIDENRLAQTDTFKRFCDRILDALEPHVEAHDAVFAIVKTFQTHTD